MPSFASFPTFPSFDFSKLDMSQFDMSSFDLSKINFPNAQTEELATKVAGIMRDAAYVVIGFGVLTVQQVQVRRRELVDTLTDNPAVTQLGVTRTQIEDLVANLESRVGKLDETLDAFEVRFDSAVDATKQRLPEQAGALVGQAHEIAKAARKHVRGLIHSAA